LSFILDTCLLSELTRPEPAARVVAWFEAQASDALFLSAISVGEINQGVELLASGRRRRALTAWLAELRTEFAGRILGVDADIAMRWGRLSARAKAQGRPLSVADGLIAATAERSGFHVVTRNAKDFDVTGIAILNPWH
jgi:toxin FitB